MSFYRFARAIVTPFVKILFPTKIIGKENFPEGKTVVLSNHYSAIDVAVIAVGLFKRNFNGLSKKELYKNKFFAKVLKKLGGIPIDRDGNDISAIKSAIGVLMKGEKLFVCPEGTRNRGDYKKMLPLKSGASVIAIRTKTPILLVLLNNKPKIFRRNYLMIGKPFELEAFYGDRSSDMKERATEILAKGFSELRTEMEYYISLSKKERRAYENNRR